MELDLNVQYKCGICKWVINTYCNKLEDHQCFTNFEDNLHQFVVDEQSYIYMELQPPVNTETENASNTYEETPNCEHQEAPNVANLRWTDDAILCLIDLYKEHYQDFLSTKEKTDKVWGRVALALRANGFNYTDQQCKFKFKYLKSKYMQKKDNMRNTSTGQAPVNFKYFDQMDEICGKKPNVKPVSLASNLIQRKVPLSENSDQSNNADDQVENVIENTATQPRKKKCTNSPIGQLITAVRDNATKREANRQQRHQENLEFRKELLSSFNNKMDALINILNKH